MQPQDDRSLWDLLNQARTPRVPGNFADNVLRRLRLEATESPESTLRAWWSQSWRMLSGLTAGAALLATAVLFQENQSPNSVAVVENISPDISALLAVDDIDSLGDLETALDDNDIWLGTSSY